MDLKPCPFCGTNRITGAGSAKKLHGKKVYAYHIVCSCGARLRAHSKEAAIAGWNMRAMLANAD